MDGRWGWRSTASKHWWNRIYPKLCDMERLTWAKLKETSGGRSQGTNHHPVSVGHLIAAAQTRLRELRQDDVDELFSLRLTGRARVYGIRDGRALKLLWYDHNHEIYPISR